MDASVSGDPIERLIAGTLPDPDGAGRLAVRTRKVVIGRGVLAELAALLGELDLPRPVALVADPATWQAAGAAAAEQLGRLGPVRPVLLGERPHPDAATLEQLQALTAGAPSLLAVGSGTINDLTRMVAARTGRPYAVLGTALSMNGYGSENAAITIDGHKKTLPAVPATAILLDLDVVAAAPVRLTRAGLGDSICRPTAQSDWLLAHLLLGTPYRTAPFRLLEADEPVLLERAAGLVTGDLRALTALARTLVLSGFGMAICGSSAPASQAEHLVSHWLDMLGDPGWPRAFHGEQIAVTTLTIASIQAALFAGPVPVLGTDPVDDAALVATYGEALAAECAAELAAKRLDAAATRALNERLARDWPAIRARLLDVHVPPERLRAVLLAAGVPTTPADLGIPADAYARAVRHAREIRGRFTILDLAALGGRLDGLLKR